MPSAAFLVVPYKSCGDTVVVINQRLVRMICSQCTEPAALPSEVEAHVRDLAVQGGYTVPADATFYHGVGCPECAGRGYRGRTVIYELLEFTPAVREAFLRGANAAELLRIAIEDGMHTQLADGIRKAVEGIISVDEVLRVAAEK